MMCFMSMTMVGLVRKVVDWSFDSVVVFDMGGVVGC